MTSTKAATGTAAETMDTTTVEMSSAETSTITIKQSPLPLKENPKKKEKRKIERENSLRRWRLQQIAKGKATLGNPSKKTLYPAYNPYRKPKKVTLQ